MRVSLTSLLALSALAVLAVSTDAGFTIEENPICSGYLFGPTCDCNIACLKNESYPVCSPDVAAEFALVAPLLQQCQDISYFFNKDVWTGQDSRVFCNINSPCGTLVPYIRHLKPHQRLCGPYETFKYVLATFDGVCRNSDAAKIPGDNGLLASLQPSAVPKPTPARTRPVDFETPEPIPNSETPTPASSSTTPSSTTPPATTTKPDEKSTDANAKTTSDAATSGSISQAVLACAMLAVGAFTA